MAGSLGRQVPISYDSVALALLAVPQRPTAGGRRLLYVDALTKPRNCAAANSCSACDSLNFDGLARVPGTSGPSCYRQYG